MYPCMPRRRLLPGIAAPPSSCRSPSAPLPAKVGGKQVGVALAENTPGMVYIGVAGLTLVEVGRRGGRGWFPAARSAVLSGLSRPAPVLGMGLTLMLAVLLAVFIPVTTPILAGFALFALHAIARRP
jgi:hypothetical protein